MIVIWWTRNKNRRLTKALDYRERFERANDKAIAVGNPMGFLRLARLKTSRPRSAFKSNNAGFESQVLVYFWELHRTHGEMKSLEIKQLRQRLQQLEGPSAIDDARQRCWSIMPFFLGDGEREWWVLGPDHKTVKGGVVRTKERAFAIALDHNKTCGVHAVYVRGTAGKNGRWEGE